MIALWIFLISVSFQIFVRKVIELHDKYLAYVNDCFANHSLFHKVGHWHRHGFVYVLIISVCSFYVFIFFYIDFKTTDACMLGVYFIHVICTHCLLAGS